MIRDGLSPREATSRFYPLTSTGLLLVDSPGLLDFQEPYTRSRDEVTSWAGDGAAGQIGLAEVVAHAHPTMLIGTSTHSGAFTEAIVKDMADHTDRPIIMALSNPTSKCEALPEDLIAWTNGRVLTATGSPFAPVVHNGRTYQIAQASNALVFPGLGWGHRRQGPPNQ
jgi:malate dehydrogenase (oxaloacetate-decarboxylating)